MAIEDDFAEAPPPPAPPSEGLDGFVRANPIAAVVGALIAGIVLGRLGIL